MSNFIRNIKKDILLNCRSNVIDNLSNVSDKLINTLPITNDFYDLCDLYISLHNNLKKLDEEIETIISCERNNYEEEV